MSAPTSSQELASFLGLATYMGPFIPNLSSLAAPLRALTRKDAVFDWLPAAKESFDKIKQVVSDSTTLSYIDARKPVVLQVDASMKVLGAVLIQDGKPVAFATARHCHRHSRVTPTSDANFSPSCTAVRNSTTTCLADPSPSTRTTSRLQVFT